MTVIDESSIRGLGVRRSNVRHHLFTFLKHLLLQKLRRCLLIRARTYYLLIILKACTWDLYFIFNSPSLNSGDFYGKWHYGQFNIHHQGNSALWWTPSKCCFIRKQTTVAKVLLAVNVMSPVCLIWQLAFFSVSLLWMHLALGPCWRFLFACVNSLVLHLSPASHLTLAAWFIMCKLYMDEQMFNAALEGSQLHFVCPHFDFPFRQIGFVGSKKGRRSLSR